MKMLKLWAHPAIIVSLWIVAAAFTLSELATVAPSLRSGPTRHLSKRAPGDQGQRHQRRQGGSHAEQPGHAAPVRMSELR